MIVVVTVNYTSGKQRTTILYEMLMFACSSTDLECLHIRCFSIRELCIHLYVEESSKNEYLDTHRPRTRQEDIRSLSSLVDLMVSPGFHL